MYSFGHKHEVATLVETDEYLELSLKLDKGFESLKYLSKYKDSISLAGIKDDMAIIRIHNVNHKENLTQDLIEFTNIKCEIDIQRTGNEVVVHLWFSETPYKKCIKFLENEGLNHNKRRTKWWGSLSTDEIGKLIHGVSQFKYLNIDIRQHEYMMCR